MAHLDAIARSGGSGSSGGPPPATVSFAPTGRAKCKSCGGAIQKGELRVTTYVASRHHDGYDAQHYKRLCAPKNPRAGFDVKSVSLLPWRDQLDFVRDDAQKAALRANAAAQRANELLVETRTKLVNDVKPKDVKALVEENFYTLESGPKSKPLEVLVDTAADGLCFGLLPKCPVCGNRSLRHGGHGQGAYALTWCTGYASASTACSYASRGPVERESAAWAGSHALRKGKAHAALAALLEAADARAGRDAPDASSSPPPKKKAKRAEAVAPDPSPRLKPVPKDSRLLVVDDMALQEAGHNHGAGSAEVVCIHSGRTAMNVQLLRVDAESEANSFYRLQCLRVGGGYAVFSRWGRVGEDDGLRTYNTFGDSTANKCMLHWHASLDAAAKEFASVFSRHTRNDWNAYAALRAFTAKPGCYDIVRHVDAELADDAAAAPSRPPPLPADLDALGVKALKGLAGERGVNISGCFEKRDIVDALKAACPAATTPAAPPRAAAQAPASLSPAVESFVRLVMSKKMLEEELSKRDVDTGKFPLGEISLSCVKAAYAALSAASAELERVGALDPGRVDDVERARHRSAVQMATNDFLRAVPHRVDRGGMAALRLDGADVISEKLDLVAALEQILVRMRLDRAGGPSAGPAEDAGSAVCRQYASLNCGLAEVPRTSGAFATVRDYLQRGCSGYVLEALFEATVAGQEAAFAPHKGSNVMLLWHGSSLSNWAGILNGGLRIAPPEAPANGYNFDKGLYYADIAKKSAQRATVWEAAK
mmetsp:Transcript_3029/g.8852  ORF Transcript_3029/g.8852 Transcript_3029/m.8852 type:complete len:767 (+) Transcript_3029:272-2572(+)